MAVRFKLDENLPRNAEPLLRDAGHDVQTVLDEALGGEPDRRVLDASRDETRVLITSGDGDETWSTVGVAVFARMAPIARAVFGSGIIFSTRDARSGFLSCLRTRQPCSS